jgi:hypothetical protein
MIGITAGIQYAKNASMITEYAPTATANIPHDIRARKTWWIMDSAGKRKIALDPQKRPDIAAPMLKNVPHLFCPSFLTPVLSYICWRMYWKRAINSIDVSQLIEAV